MLESIQHINLIGSITANLNNFLLSGIFISRIYNKRRIEYWLGIFFIFTIIPLIFLLVEAITFERSLLYFIQIILMIAFIILELILDYIIKPDFREKKKTLIPYITLFYASTGGMIGVAGQSGKTWSIITINTFLLMVIFSLIMHIKTERE